MCEQTKIGIMFRKECNNSAPFSNGCCQEDEVDEKRIVRNRWADLSEDELRAYHQGAIDQHAIDLQAATAQKALDDQKNLDQIKRVRAERSNYWKGLYDELKAQKALDDSKPKCSWEF